MTEQLLTAVPHADTGEHLFDWLASMRADNPVWREPSGVHNVFRHADVQRVITDPEVFSNDASRVFPDLAELARGNINSMDPPLHGKLRKLVGQAFTPKLVAQLAPRIADITDELLAEITEDRFDLVDSLAYPLPVVVIAELLGVPAVDRTQVRIWVDQLLAQQNADPTAPDFLDIVIESMREMKEYLLAHCRERRRAPTDDLVSRLVTAEVDGERLTDEEVVNFTHVLFITGHITTTLLLGNTVLCLDENQDADAQVRADHSLIPATLEEVLRYRSPFTTVSRVTTREVELAGYTIEANQMVSPWIISANHDERAFPNARRFDIHRKSSQHIAFGRGIHFCLGAPLARLEGQIVLAKLLDTFAELRVDRPEPITFHERGMYGVKNLPVRVRRERS